MEAVQMSRSKPLLIEVDTVGDALVVSPTGLLEVATAPQLRDQLLKCMADQPRAVIVKLQNLVLEKAYTLSVFTSVARATANWSGIPLILVTGTGHTRDQQRHNQVIARFIPVFPDLASALALMHQPPARQVMRLHLTADPFSSVVARRFVASTCELWRCEEISEDAVAIASELVGNTVLHAHTCSVLRLELRRQLLTVALADRDPALPVRRPTAPTAPTEQGGLGLDIIGTLATAWGTNPTSDGGKIVWATIRLRMPSAAATLNNHWRRYQ
jgi:anti-sigma regulatory factor (Ser/Thr protein kinase)